MRQVKVGLIGCGTVGTGVAKMLVENSAIISSRIGIPIILKYVADIDIKKDRGIHFEAGVMISDANKIIDDPEIDIVIELIGGEGVAKDLMLKAIDKGKHIVTANKALIAHHGNSIFRKASEKGVDIAFEASVGGCMPIIKSLRESLVGNRIISMTGILNGTCNYILSKITNEGSSFQNALSQAQANGFAEADPTLDIEGFDTAHKLSILNALAYGMEVNFKDIYVEGISGITPMDIEFAQQFGYAIKLLAISKSAGEAIEARVHPTMIPFGNILSNVNGSLNAVTIRGDAVGEMLLYGHGAGMMPTASAVISDVADLARNIISGAKDRMPKLSHADKNIKPIRILPIYDVCTEYYFRFSAADSPGVLSKISGILGDNEISIKSVHQKGRTSEGPVPLVMLTHHAKEADVQKALTEIARLDIVKDKPVLIRIED